MTFYQTAAWRRLSRATKLRDGYRCQVCADRSGDPHIILHAHHVVPRAQGGADDPTNLITLCDLCHAVVTRRWHKPWFPNASAIEMAAMREDYEWLLALPVARRNRVRDSLWQAFGI